MRLWPNKHICVLLKRSTIFVKCIYTYQIIDSMKKTIIITVINVSKPSNTKACRRTNTFSVSFPFKASFPLALRAEKPRLDGALAQRQLSGRLREQTLHLYPYVCANTHTQTDRQTHVRANRIQRWEVERSLTPTSLVALGIFLFCIFSEV